MKAAFLHALTGLLLLIPLSIVADTAQYHIDLKNHLFSPHELAIPSGVKVKLIVHNHDDVAEEFDSFDLNREKVLFPNQKATIYIGPLSPGRYEYFGEFNPTSARGYILVEVDKRTQGER